MCLVLARELSSKPTSGGRWRVPFAGAKTIGWFRSECRFLQAAVRRVRRAQTRAPDSFFFGCFAQHGKRRCLSGSPALQTNNLISAGQDLFNRRFLFRVRVRCWLSAMAVTTSLTRSASTIGGRFSFTEHGLDIFLFHCHHALCSSFGLVFRAVDWYELATLLSALQFGGNGGDVC